MRLTLVMVSSIDGKSTAPNIPTHEWTSKEDFEYFSKIVKKGKLMIMGSKTYEEAKDIMRHKKGKLRIILTKNPNKYSDHRIPGQLEFVNETPIDLIKRLKTEGHTEAYLFGGAETNTQFFKNNLITDFWLTVEPKLFGIGNGLISEEKIQVNLALISTKKLNKKGSLLLRYKVQSKER